MKRTKIEVRYVKEGKDFITDWHVFKNGRRIERWCYKENAVRSARLEAKRYQSSQLIIKKRNGQIQTEHTYPRSSDPNRSKG